MPKELFSYLIAIEIDSLFLFLSFDILFILNWDPERRSILTSTGRHKDTSAGG